MLSPATDLDCKTVVFFANASNSKYSNERSGASVKPVIKCQTIRLANYLGFVLKLEQKEAMELLLKGRDVFGVLSTGFGKSLIFQLFVLAKNRASNSPNASVERSTIIVICLLKSIMEEQITYNKFRFVSRPFVASLVFMKGTSYFVKKRNF